MSRFARLFFYLTTWTLEEAWSLTEPMTVREWHRYYILLDEPEDILRDERPEESAVEVRVETKPRPRRMSSTGVMDLGRKHLGWSEDI